ncbi:RNA polymerase sigma factor [Mucilaginibacter auburnensis]|uniref:RNA polymerase sigma-70 factor (ECF subfamily) n=1 Tax=Mucilaginibacter auburnensis TaxID=1457233 RepID=A0A2H9VR83_9SPHI|nr:sigma-70 family RNA polymerase sigma factor [Mucilaginibacter auburnensis]PJJ83313.1 RNA polymerase sigma-70 factor (ECF subfamily) [Mucilaginibacter auburnensis]
MGEIKRIVEQDDKQLVVRLILGDEKAFDLLYNKYHVSIYRNILKLVKSEDTAKDILQEVFVCLWEKRNKIDVNKPIANWLFVISYNKSISFLKKCANALVIFEDVIIDISADNAEPFITEEKLAFIEKTINRLSPQKKRVLELCKIERRTYEEAAKEMGISRHTVKEYLTDAVATLKFHVKNHFDDPAVVALVLLFMPFLKK